MEAYIRSDSKNRQNPSVVCQHRHSCALRCGDLAVNIHLFQTPGSAGEPHGVAAAAAANGQYPYGANEHAVGPFLQISGVLAYKTLSANTGLSRNGQPGLRQFRGTFQPD